MAQKRPRPPHVQAAVLRGDRAACSELGKRGAQKRAQLKAKKMRVEEKKEGEGEAEIIKRILEEALLRGEFEERAIEANEHICPID